MNANVEAEIDRRIDFALQDVEEYYLLAINGLSEFVVESRSIGNPDGKAILQDIAGVTTENFAQRILVADFLDQIADEVDVYPTEAANSENLRSFGNLIRKLPKPR